MKILNWLLIFVFLQNFQFFITFTLNCNFRVSSLNQIGQIYECFTENIPTKSGNNVTGISGTHLGGRKNENVTSIWIQGNNTLPFFPRQISKYFPNIVSFQLFFTSIEFLNGDELEDFGKNLKYFVLTFSKLKTISSRLFEKTPNVHTIWFDYNLIEQVGFDLLTPFNLTNLINVNFNTNNCINMNSRTHGILELFQQLRLKCPYNNEPTTTTITVPTTTTTTLSTTTTSTVSTSTTISTSTTSTASTTNAIKEEKCYFWDRKNRSKKYRNLEM